MAYAMEEPPQRQGMALLVLRVLRAVQDDGMSVHRARCRRLWPNREYHVLTRLTPDPRTVRLL